MASAADSAHLINLNGYVMILQTAIGFDSLLKSRNQSSEAGCCNLRKRNNLLA
jgi:hypothetical protein